ncbi:MAG: ISL3 family transposase [Bdellovibrionales bacterium]|nr:ISL3 family transposase [Bdellovibrionales bacterium]
MNLDLATYTILLNITNLEVERVELEKKEIRIFCKITTDDSQACPNCGGEVITKRPKYRREIRDLDISGRKVILHLLVHQYSCDCGRTFSETFDFVEPGKSYTKRQAKYIFEMSAKQSHLQVAALTDMCHKTVERICYEQVLNRQVNWAKIRRIGIDEFAFKKGHNDFITVLIDLDTHDIIDILEQRDKAFLRAYFQGLGEGFCQQILEFCSDMWGPFQDLAKELFPNALIHVDRFHWTLHLNKVLDNLRKQLRRDDKEEAAFKNLKWKLIKRPENLNAQEEKDLQTAFEIAPELEEVYQMRNTFLAIFDTAFSYDFAVEQINHWIEHATGLKNKYLSQFVSLFQRHRENILNYFKTRLSSGAVEGTNNLLRTVKRFTFNMSNFLHFKFRVFAFST